MKNSQVRLAHRNVSKRISVLSVLCMVAMIALFVLPTSASANSSVKLSTLIVPNSQMHLFGTDEKRSTNLSAFTKWTGMLKRYQKQMNSPQSAAFQVWAARFNYLKDEPLSTKLRQINNIVNLNRYVPDQKGWGVSDHWATPLEFLERQYGDCEDFAITKLIALKALGVSESQMRIAVVQDLKKNVAHAVLVVMDQGRSYLLDNQIKEVVPTNTVKHYKPYYSISSTAWWLHKPAVNTASIESAAR